MNFSQLQNRVGHSAIVFEFLLIAITMMLFAPAQATLHGQETATQNKPASQELPTGEEVMTAHVAKTGGQQAYDNLKNRVAESTLEIVGQGISLDITTYAARPNKTLVRIDSKLTGKIDKGCDGKVVWEKTLVGGPVVHSGAQHRDGLRNSTFERFAYWKSIYETAECTSKTKVRDFECYVVVLTPKKIGDAKKADNPMKLFVDTSNYLIRKIETTIESEAGNIKVIAYPGDYRQVDGIMVSHKLQMELMGQKREVTINSIKHNIDMPENTFDLPADVKKLIR